MIERQTWVEHKFNFNIKPSWAYNILDRVADNPIRILHHFREIHDGQLSLKPANKWSIKEHIGHLIDLEELHRLRLTEFIEKSPILRAADMSNLKTKEADYNSRNFDDIYSEFAESRKKFIDQYKALKDDVLTHKTEHPRLRVIMQPVDMLFFVGEHDDHHITSMLQILRKPTIV